MIDLARYYTDRGQSTAVEGYVTPRNLDDSERLPLGTKVRIKIPQDQDLPGGWAGIRSMIDIGTLTSYNRFNDGRLGIQINFPTFGPGFSTEAWCIEAVYEDNAGFIEDLPRLPDELQLEQVFPFKL